MDVAAYELLRQGKTEAGTAQVCQNLKAKLQSVLQGGSWNTAWLLTGLPDPFEDMPYAGSRKEMAIIASYQKEMSKLQQLVESSYQASAAKKDGEE